MKLKNIRNIGNETAFLSDGRVFVYTKYIDKMDVLPVVEINQGNKVDPTAWKYTIDFNQRYLGKYHYVSDPKTCNIGAIYTGNGTIYEMAPWDRVNLYNRALSRLNAKARENVDWSEDIADFARTRKMLLHPIDSARELLADALMSGREKLPRKPKRLGTSSYYRNVGASRKAPYAEGGLRSDWTKGLRESTKLAANLHLTTAFALKPLVQNIYDTAVVIMNKGTTEGVLLRAGAKQPIRVDSRVQNRDIRTSSKSLYHVEKGMQGCRIHVILRAQPDWNILDLVSLNPALWAWNALPYSFVIDWFFDIGGYLQNLEDAFRFNALFKSGYVDHIYANYVTEESKGHLDPYGNIFTDFARARRRKIDFEREVLHAWPLPRVPRVNTDLGSGALLSAAALLRGLLK